jgi:saccharopine dehydrogenase-like NADP-dependent oxidoreductase
VRIVILGGYGNFGARICRALATDRSLTIIAAGRRADATAGHSLRDVHAAALNITSPDFEVSLRALNPALVIHCAGPFQGQDYRPARAALACGANYIDLSDGRDFVAGFSAAVDDLATQANRLAVTGASTLPALSSAVVDAYARQFSALKSIDTVIAPAQRAPRGAATLAGVLSYAGLPFSVWEHRAWRTRHGWQDLRKVDLGPIGKRLSAVCDVPDLALFPARYPGVADVRFRAALEVGAPHLAIWLLAVLRRAGLNFPIDRFAARLDAIAKCLDGFGTEVGGMTITLLGIAQDGSTLELRWQVTAPGNHGPEIPCMAAILLARKLAAGKMDRVGAMPCMGLIALEEFAAEFARWGMQSAIEERH